MSRRLRFFLLTGWALTVAALVPLSVWGAFAAFQWVTTSGNYLTSSNATVTGDLVTVSSVNAGRVTDLHLLPGAPVKEGEPLVSIELPAPVRTTAGGTPVLAYLGSKDQAVELVSPIDGLIATVAVANGSAVTAGQVVARLVDPTRLWVTAYVDETQVSQVRVGQAAEVYLNATGRTLQGDVTAVVPATSSITTPPATGATIARTDTVLTHLYPVYIRVDLANSPQLLGSSAQVKIRIK